MVIELYVDNGANDGNDAALGTGLSLRSRFRRIIPSCSSHKTSLLKVFGNMQACTDEGVAVN